MQNNSKKIILAGMPDMANVCLIKLAQAGFNIVAVVPPNIHHPSYPSLKQCAEAFNIPVFSFETTPNDEEYIQKLKELEADIGIITSFDIKFSKEFLSTTKDGFINCHPSLLPKYRGANPYFHIIKNGETITGATLHFADENFDTGNIILQREIPLEPKETMGTLFNRTNFLIADSLIDVLRHYEHVGSIPSKKQPEGEFIKAPKIDPNIIIDFNCDVEEIERIIRASNPFYNAILFFRGTMFKIVCTDIELEEHNFEMGEIVRTLDGLKIAVKNGFLLPKMVQVGTWGFFDEKDFVEKFTPQIGERLTNG